MSSSLYIIHPESYLIDFHPRRSGFVLYINIQTDDLIIFKEKSL